ncbi:hypothetical protein EVAR_102911_1 [Eumeta japonica]|uniref:Uncharacterized protein n=1 Tax=Eumeta variegata TaxID=151549 RepID=A0A4C1ZMB1_EUMVA|nr:hypothetical protein EVAR_102911_1 [Eumeta japonica]
MPNTSGGPASSPGYNTSIVQIGEPVSENSYRKKSAPKVTKCGKMPLISSKMQTGKIGGQLYQGTSDSDTEEFQKSSNHTQYFSSDECSPQAPENITNGANDANSSTPAGKYCRRYRERLNARRTRAEEDPSLIYTSYIRHNGAHNLFENLFQNNPFGFACTVCDRLWFENDLKSPPLSCQYNFATNMPNCLVAR